MPDRTLPVALAQATSVPGDVGENARRAAALIAACGARLVVFPELSLTGYDLPMLRARPDAWVLPDDPRLAPVREACAATGATAVLGAPMRHDVRAYLAAPVVDGTGAVHVSYKEHIHASEAEMFVPGPVLPPVDVAGWRVAVGICFDAAKPRHAEAAAAAGADVYAVSALYDVGEERRLDLHLGARAMDQRMFALLANHADTTGGHVACGGSGAWSPTGARLAGAVGRGPEVVTVELDPAALRPYR